MALKKTIRADGIAVYSLDDSQPVGQSKQTIQPMSPTNSPVVRTVGQDGVPAYSLNPNFKPISIKKVDPPAIPSELPGTKPTTEEKRSNINSQLQSLYSQYGEARNGAVGSAENPILKHGTAKPAVDNTYQQREALKVVAPGGQEQDLSKQLDSMPTQQAQGAPAGQQLEYAKKRASQLSKDIGEKWAELAIAETAASKRGAGVNRLITATHDPKVKKLMQEYEALVAEQKELKAQIAEETTVTGLQKAIQPLKAAWAGFWEAFDNIQLVQERGSLGKVKDPYLMQSSAQSDRFMDEKVRGELGKLWGAVSDITGTAGVMAPYIISEAVSGGAGIGAMVAGTEAGGRAYQSARQDGYSDEQALAYGLATGGINSLLRGLAGKFSFSGNVTPLEVSAVSGKMGPAAQILGLASRSPQGQAMLRSLSTALRHGGIGYASTQADKMTRNTFLGETNEVGLLDKDAMVAARNTMITAGVVDAIWNLGSLRRPAGLGVPPGEATAQAPTDLPMVAPDMATTTRWPSPLPGPVVTPRAAVSMQPQTPGVLPGPMQQNATQGPRPLPGPVTGEFGKVAPRPLPGPNVATPQPLPGPNTTPPAEVGQTSEDLVGRLRSSIPSLQQVEPVAHIKGTEFPKGPQKLTEQVGAFFQSLGNKVKRVGFGEVILNNDGVQSSIAHGLGQAKASAFAAVPGVLQHGVQIDHQTDWKGRGYDTYVFAGPYLSGEGAAMQKNYIAAIVIKGRNNRYYLHEVLDGDGNRIYSRQNEKHSLPLTLQGGIANDGDTPGQTALSNTNIADAIVGVNGSLPGTNSNIPGEASVASQAPYYGSNTVGAAQSKSPSKQKVSKVASNTYTNTPLFTEADRNSLHLNEMDAGVYKDGSKRAAYTYDVVGEKQSLREAAERLADDYAGEYTGLEGKQYFDGVDTDTAMMILEQLTAEARKTGNYSEVNRWSKMIQKKGTEAGQRIQAFAKYTRTPEGTVVKAQRAVEQAHEKWAAKNPDQAKAMDTLAHEIERVADQYHDELPADPTEALANLNKAINHFIETNKKVDEDLGESILQLIQDGRADYDAAYELLRIAEQIPTLSDQDIMDIMHYMAEAESLPEGSKEQMQMEARAYKVVADQFRATWVDKWNAWRYMSMLTSAPTHIRNFGGNIVMNVVTNAKDVIGTGIEAGYNLAAQRLGGPKIQRTKSVINRFSEADRIRLKAAKEDFRNVYSAVTGTGKRNPGSMIQDNRTIFKTRFLEWARKANLDALEAADLLGLRTKYAQAMAGFMKANNIPLEALEGKGMYSQAKVDEGRAYAVKQALEATFRDRSIVAEHINTIKRANIGTQIVGEGMMPFTKTPINIGKRAVEYSPVGLAETITVEAYKLKKGITTADQFVDSLSKGLTGTAIFLLGMWLAHIGVLRSSGPEKDREQQFDRLQGVQDYSINFGDHSYTLGWVAPAAIPLFAGAELAQDMSAREGKDFNFKVAADSVTKLLDPMMEMTLLQGLNSALRTAAYGGEHPVGALVMNAATNYATQGVPTMFGQVARSLDDTRRTARVDPNSPMPAIFDRTMQKAAIKVPGLSMAQQPYIDQWGREEKNTGGNFAGRLAYNMLSPGYYSHRTHDPVNNEISKLFEATKESSVLPSYAQKSVSNNGKTHLWTNEEYTKYAKERGQTAYSTINSLVKTREYKQLSEGDRVKAIKAAYEYATYCGAREVLGRNYVPSSTYSTAEKMYNASKNGVKVQDYIVYRQLREKQSHDATMKALNGTGMTVPQKAHVWAIEFPKSDNPYR